MREVLNFALNPWKIKKYFLHPLKSLHPYYSTNRINAYLYVNFSKLLSQSSWVYIILQIKGGSLLALTACFQHPRVTRKTLLLQVAIKHTHRDHMP